MNSKPVLPADLQSAVAAEERRFQTLVNAFTDYAIYMLDPTGTITSWNPGAERITGFTGDEMIGRHFSHLYPADALQEGAADNALAVAADEGRYSGEGWLRRKDGGRYWALSVVEAVRDPSGRLSGFAKIERDMTERREAEQALFESERRFRLLVNGVVDYAIYMVDPMGIVTNWNLGAERIKGYTASEIVGQHFSRFYTPEDRRAGRPTQSLERAAAEGKLESEGWRVRKDGSRFWASVVIDPIRDEHGVLQGFAKITRDITERREAHEALRESERQFRMLVAGVSDYAIFMLDPNGIVTNWNTGAARIKGYRAEEIVGHHFSRFYSEADRAAGEPIRALNTAAETGRYESEGWRVRKDGSLFFAHVIIDAIRDEAGHLVGFAKITRDITERRQAEAALQAAKEQLAQAQKMEALGKLTGGVAHDFNNLLMIVGGYAQMLRRRVDTDPQIERALQAIESATRQGQSLTRQMLAFARRTPIAPRVLELKSWLEAFQAMLVGPAAGANRLVASCDEGAWPVYVDQNELELAVMNMVLNARDAMPDSGSITVHVENRVLDGKAEGLTDFKGDYVAISVSDTGVGIADDILAKVFDPFFTTKAPNRGVGLGLSQVYGFAKQSDGAVTIDSTLGSGTTVTIYLPRARADGETVETDDGPVATGANQGRSILLVEDNPDVLTVTTAMLEELGHAVRPVGNAQAALDALAEGTAFDLVLSDVVMAGKLDGLGLARLVRQRYPQTVVILASGYSKAADEAQAEFPILRKPYTLSELGQTIARVLVREHKDGANLVDFMNARKNRPPKGER